MTKSISILIKTLSSSLLGTGLMTASSAMMSSWRNNFREPDQLEIMVVRLVPLLKGKNQKLAGWAAHYLVGLLFCMVYVYLWEQRKLKSSFGSGIILGALSGIIGMCIWKVSFLMHPLPPLKNYRTFYWQRIPAHLVFALFATLGYRIAKLMLNPKENVEMPPKKSIPTKPMDQYLNQDVNMDFAQHTL